MKKLGKLLRNMLLVCGVLFIIVLLLPDDEEMSANQEQTGVETAAGIGTQTGTETAAGAEHAAGAAEKFLSGRYGKGETDRDKRRWKGPSDRVCLYEWFGSGIGGRRGNGGSL